MKRVFCLALAFFSVFFVSAQSSIRLGVLKGVACSPCAYLIENKSKLAVQNTSFKIYDSVQSELPELLRGEIDVAFIAPKDALKVYSLTDSSIVMLGVVQNSNLSLLTNDESFSSFVDLIGKTILCDEKDSASSEIFSHLLKKKFNLPDGSVKFDFSVPNANIPNTLILQKADYALVSEPFATIALSHSKKLRRAENIQTLYMDSEGGTSFPALILVARSDFAKNNRDLLRRFVDVYKNAVNWTNKNPAKAASLCEKHKVYHASAVIRKSIPQAALVWRDSSVARYDLEKFFEILQLELPAETAEDFYFRK